MGDGNIAVGKLAVVCGYCCPSFCGPFAELLSRFRRFTTLVARLRPLGIDLFAGKQGCKLILFSCRRTIWFKRWWYYPVERADKYNCQ